MLRRVDAGAAHGAPLPGITRNGRERCGTVQVRPRSRPGDVARSLLALAALAGTVWAAGTVVHAQSAADGRIRASTLQAGPLPAGNLRVGEGVPTPQLFASIYLLRDRRWVQAQTNAWTAIDTVSLGQPVLFTLSVQTSVPGFANPGADLELFKLAPGRTRVPAGQVPGTHVLYRADMAERSPARGWARFSLRVVFASPVETGHLFDLVRALFARAGSVGHQFPLTIRGPGK